MQAPWEDVEYNGSITDYTFHFYLKPGELEALMKQKGVLTIWFTSSTTDNNWQDLNELI